MATQFNFNGQLVKLPGVYSQVKSGITNPPLNLSYGNILIIDTDPNSKFGGGAGINGNLAQEKDSIYTFDNIRSFRSFVRGGKYWDLAGPLFKPFGAGNNGISQLNYIRALTTTSAELVLDLTTSGDGGTFTLEARHEGALGNGEIGDATSATASFEVTAVGAASDTIPVVANGTLLYTYVSNGTDTPTQAAATIVDGINANTAEGYTASNVAGVVTVFAPSSEGADANTFTFVVTPTGTATVGSVTTPFAGGVTGTLLSQGFGMIISTSPTDNTKFIAKFFRGTYTGLASDGLTYDGISESQAAPELIATSDAFNTFDGLKAWMDIDFDFNNNFKIKSSAINGTGAVIAADVVDYTVINSFSGGAQTFSASDLTTVLDSIAELDYTFVMAPDSGSEFNSANNNAILSHLVDDARFEKFMMVAGGDDRNTYVSQSIAAANAYDTDRVIVVHGGVQVASNVAGTGLRDKSAEYKTSAVLGRMAGLEPQTPITFKGLSYAAELHALTKNEKEQGLDEGVLITAFDGDIGAFVIVQGVNSLQRNRNVVNEDGTSHSIQLKRISAQLNKEIEVNAKVSLLGNQNVGPNRNTLSPAVVEEWLRGYLGRKTASTTIDNLILSYQDISVEVVQDAYSIRYAFTPNFEVNKLFFTGLIIDPNL